MECDVCIIGGGSAGIGSALAASRNGLRTILIEKDETIGGNAVRGGVHNWEPGVGGTAFPKEIYERMARVPNGVGIWSFGRHWCWPESNHPPFPGGEQLIDPSCCYEDTLRRSGTNGLLLDEERVRAQWHGVIFEPEVYVATVRKMLAEQGTCQVLCNTKLVDALGSDGRVHEIQVEHKNRERTRIRASFFIDCTASVTFCRMLGCETMLGEEPRQAFHEPSAPEHANSQKVNAVTLVYRVTPVSQHHIEPLPGDIPVECWFQEQWCGASIGMYPCGDRNINMLPTMEGEEFLSYVREGGIGYAEAYKECRKRVLGHWHFIQTHYPEFRAYRISWIAPSLGVREGPRVKGEYVLTELDVRSGLSHQKHEDIIAIADHAFDVHGNGSRGCVELREPYGVPFRCLIPRGWENLLVAGRGASFTHIAASSCRLSRTMMDLGHAAGSAVAVAMADGTSVSEVNVRKLQDILIKDGADLGLSTTHKDRNG